MQLQGLFELWIGFKLYLCLIDYQLNSTDKENDESCELVSNCIFVLLIINFLNSINSKRAVVNWFQIVSLSYWLSTFSTKLSNFVSLWIGFKLYLCLIDYQLILTAIMPLVVVNWFQIVSLSYWLSTFGLFLNHGKGLWIGFKLYLCLIDYQRGGSTLSRRLCCELVSNCIFVLLIINIIFKSSSQKVVVNWFQIVSLSYWLSTTKIQRFANTKLWIGFKLYLCLIDYQLLPNYYPWLICCELVSNCIFVLLIINQFLLMLSLISVVNWFQIVSLSYWLSTYHAIKCWYIVI